MHEKSLHVVVEIPDGQKLSAKLNCVRENNIKLNVKIGCEHVDRIYVTEHRVQYWAVVNTR
jgi:hypothetical protein